MEYAIFVAVELLAIHLVSIAVACNIFDKSLDLAIAFVNPRVGVSPMVVEVVLHYAHLLSHSLFGIGLHARIDGAYYFQAVGIEIVARFVAPLLEFLSHGLAEVKRLAIVGLLHAEPQVEVEF